MSIKKQLSAYYDKQGLTGKHHRKAMQHDMKAVRENIKAFHGCDSPAPTSLGSAFIFDGAPEGYEYWARRAYGNWLM